MTDAAKSDGQVLKERLLGIGYYSDDATYARIAAAVVANARERIRAETVEDVIALGNTSVSSGGIAVFMQVEEERIRALAAAPPGFVCVSIDRMNALQEAAKVMRALQRGDGPYDYQAQCDAEDRFDAAFAKMEE